MARPMEAVKEELASLSAEDRHELIYFLLCTLDKEEGENNAVEELKKRVYALSLEDRDKILRFLEDAREAETGPDESEEWAAELERRMKEIESGEEVGIPAEKVFAELREKYSCRAASNEQPERNSQKRSPITKK